LKAYRSSPKGKGRRVLWFVVLLDPTSTTLIDAWGEFSRRGAKVYGRTGEGKHLATLMADMPEIWPQGD
jgi:hypothetical protein